MLRYSFPLARILSDDVVPYFWQLEVKQVSAQCQRGRDQTWTYIKDPQPVPKSALFSEGPGLRRRGEPGTAAVPPGWAADRSAPPSRSFEAEPEAEEEHRSKQINKKGGIAEDTRGLSAYLINATGRERI